ncbi:MAG: protein-L-isoaspartate(D-aspartate) O-methyltransferase [Alphaproteobacteria bacterium]|jgi:protein-L-isoaspartate(D-aspartate) O-methyltransferase|nr:protein-L-isoaspartate(D-aspartate) O-methyltransferase [Alphaproteobacteria bacterium]MCB1551499.1 protein-L-isoaspartate(D-aspartate) O-methyltransferase [Alphaproteobacteria bacterium]MCB9985066.1 protein-L-isoaspartate(D-aspartate) O-methyltransferase [Micavibrio sp.]HRK97448.1 protein-L-isoaspartate(D-aspartate) O-methyltransferase [Alphaproteobacteria bacterium]
MTPDPSVIRLIIHLRQAGITNTEVLSAMERTPRDYFIPPHFQVHAYEDQAVPIGLGQTISQPYIVAYMTQELKIEKIHTVLEIGTGSGYQAAVLSHLARRVYTIERHKPLLELAEQRFQELKLRNITTLAGDGTKGWPGEQSFDRMIVTAACEGEPPVSLLAQLKIGGMMVIPVGAQGQPQTLKRYKKESEDVFAVQNLLPVRFVPLLPDVPRNNSYSSGDLEELTA